MKILLKSAVDVHVGNYLMKECFLKYLKGKTIILITHALYYLKYTDYIFVFDNGQANLHGSYEELKQMPMFNDLLLKIKKHYSENSNDNENLDDNKIEKEEEVNFFENNNNYEDKLKEKNNGLIEEENNSLLKNGKIFANNCFIN